MANESECLSAQEDELSLIIDLYRRAMLESLIASPGKPFVFPLPGKSALVIRRLWLSRAYVADWVPEGVIPSAMDAASLMEHTRLSMGSEAYIVAETSMRRALELDAEDAASEPEPFVF